MQAKVQSFWWMFIAVGLLFFSSGLASAAGPASGAATIQFTPYSPIDINTNLGFVEGPAGGIQFLYLPVRQIVWGYRVYIYWPKPPGSQWRYDKNADAYYCDFKANYSPVGSNTYRERNPEYLVLEGLTAGETYQYKVLPLCIIVKSPWSIDKYGKPFWYAAMGHPALAFAWVYTDGSAWGLVDKPGGEPEKGYYEVFSVVAEGRVTAQSAQGRGGGGGHGRPQHR